MTLQIYFSVRIDVGKNLMDGVRDRVFNSSTNKNTNNRLKKENREESLPVVT